MRVVVVAGWGTLAVYGPTDAGTGDVPVLPDWVPASSRYRPARLTLRALPGRVLDYVAVWPEGGSVPDPDTGPPWTIRQLDGVRLAQPTMLRCAVCGNQVHALYPDAFPALGEVAQHRWARGCPHCGTHADAARLHAIALFPPSPGSLCGPDPNVEVVGS